MLSSNVWLQVYEKRLSALVIGGTTDSPFDEDDAITEKNRDRWIPFGDKGSAQIVSVKCQ